MSTSYELMVIIDPEVDERTVAPQLDKFLDVIRKDGGTWLEGLSQFGDFTDD